MAYEIPEPGMPIMVEIGGRSCEIIYTMKILKDLAKAGIVLPKDMAEIYQQDPAKMSTALFYGLFTKQPDITQEWLDNNITAPMLLDMGPVLVYAITGKRPPDPKAPKPAELPNGIGPGIGSLSGPLDDTISDSVKPNSGA